MRADHVVVVQPRSDSPDVPEPSEPGRYLPNGRVIDERLEEIARRRRLHNSQIASQADYLRLPNGRVIDEKLEEIARHRRLHNSKIASKN